MCRSDLPKEPIMLASYINMKLRDEFSSLDELCEVLCIKRGWLNEKLGEINMGYDEEAKRFW